MDNIIPKYEVTELPSRFIGYPEGVKIYASPHSFGSALNIEMVGKNSINTMSETLEGIKVEGMPKNLLTPQDILFLGVYRNLLSSRHDKIDIRSFCPKCLNENHEKKSIRDIKFKTIDEFDRDVYPLEVDFNEYIMWFSFLSYKDFDFCMKRYKGHKLSQLSLQVVKYKNKSSDEIIEKPSYPSTIKNEVDIKNIQKYVSDVKSILYSLVDEDKDTLEEAVSLLEDYGLKPIEVTCQDKNCNNNYSINLEEDDVLVTPFRESEISPRNRIKLHKDDINESDRLETDESKGSGNATRFNTKTSNKKPKIEDQIEYFS